MVSLHVEPTSRCTLACPRCERTELLSKLSNQISYFNNFYATIQTSKPDYCVFNCGKCEES